MGTGPCPQKLILLSEDPYPQAIFLASDNPSPQVWFLASDNPLPLAWVLSSENNGNTAGKRDKVCNHQSEEGASLVVRILVAMSFPQNAQQIQELAGILPLPDS